MTPSRTRTTKPPANPVRRRRTRPSTARCGQCRRDEPEPQAARSGRPVSTPTMVREHHRDQRGITTPMADFIYTMRKVRKAHGDKVILDDVTLNFLPGAKIGVVGPNGAGKSSVLRIMAGLDTPNNGDALRAPGASVGILQQEPPLNEEKTVRGNVEEGLGDIKVKLDRFNEVAELMAPDYSD